MKYQLFLLFFISFSNLSGQIKFIPEVGISYINSTQDIGTTIGVSEMQVSTPKLFLGASVFLPLSKKYFVNTRFSYTKRKDLHYYTVGTLVFLYDVSHNDLIIDFIICYQNKKYFGFGIGPSFIKKINSNLKITRQSGDFTMETFTIKDLEFGLNYGVFFDYKSFRLKLQQLFRIPRSFDVGGGLLKENLHLNLSLGYMINGK